MPPQLRSRRNNKKLPTKIIPSEKLKTNKKASKIGSKESKLKSRQRNTRKSFSKDQSGYLERQYSICRYPDVYMKGEMSRHLNITVDRISVWFRNRRVKSRKEFSKEQLKYENRVHEAKMALGI
uniref:Homeobox domain-containing protein n=1 Tax=Meloidogyne incognita TaxID=6306 RepID=A0A914L5B2_MELIC